MFVEGARRRDGGAISVGVQAKKCNEQCRPRSASRNGSRRRDLAIAPIVHPRTVASDGGRGVRRRMQWLARGQHTQYG